jgi:hypothetical protein
MPHGFPENFSPIPAHVEHDVTFDVHASEIERVGLFWNRKITLRHCGCVVTLPAKAAFYGVTATWHFIFADIEHKDCPVKHRNSGFATIAPEAFKPTKEEIGHMMRHDDPFQSHALRAMDGCEIAELESVCEHGLPSWPLYLDYLPTKWSDVHSLLPKGKEHPDDVAKRAFREASESEKRFAESLDVSTDIILQTEQSFDQ